MIALCDDASDLLAEHYHLTDIDKIKSNRQYLTRDVADSLRTISDFPDPWGD